MSARAAIVAVVALAPLLGGFSLIRGEDRDVARGNEHYRQGDYATALEHYRAARARGDEPALDFNEGAALYRLAASREGGERRELLEDAARAFASAARSDAPKLRVDAYYNLGNTQFRQGRYADAVEAYKEVLRLDPARDDARHNLALALSARDRGDALAAEARARRGGGAVAEREARPEARPERGAGEGERGRTKERELDFQPHADEERRRREPAPISLDDVERKLDELERLSRATWLERLRRRAGREGVAR